MKRLRKKKKKIFTHTCMLEEISLDSIIIPVSERGKCILVDSPDFSSL